LASILALVAFPGVFYARLCPFPEDRAPASIVLVDSASTLLLELLSGNPTVDATANSVLALRVLDGAHSVLHLDRNSLFATRAYSVPVSESRSQDDAHETLVADPGGCN
jgi:hypothetical protein